MFLYSTTHFFIKKHCFFIYKNATLIRHKRLFKGVRSLIRQLLVHLFDLYKKTLNNYNVYLNTINLKNKSNHSYNNTIIKLFLYSYSLMSNLNVFKKALNNYVFSFFSIYLNLKNVVFLNKKTYLYKLYIFVFLYYFFSDLKDTNFFVLNKLYLCFNYYSIINSFHDSLIKCYSTNLKVDSLNTDSIFNNSNNKMFYFYLFKVLRFKHFNFNTPSRTTASFYISYKSSYLNIFIMRHFYSNYRSFMTHFKYFLYGYKKYFYTSMYLYSSWRFFFRYSYARYLNSLNITARLDTTKSKKLKNVLKLKFVF